MRARRARVVVGGSDERSERSLMRSLAGATAATAATASLAAHCAWRVLAPPGRRPRPGLRLAEGSEDAK